MFMIIYINPAGRLWFLKDIVYQKSSHDFDWTTERNDARTFQTRNDAWDYLHPVRNLSSHHDSNWYIIESLRKDWVCAQPTNPQDDYDRAMGVI